jgi:ankyrin repeat protein
MKRSFPLAWFFLIPLLAFICAGIIFAQDKKYSPTAIHEAAYNGNIDLVREILKTEPDRDARSSFGGTALHDSMFQKNAEIVQLLIDAGYDVNAIGPANGYTPLHDAVWANNPAAAKLLLKHGADQTIKGKDGLTPLDKAKKENKAELVQILSGK